MIIVKCPHKNLEGFPRLHFTPVTNRFPQKQMAYLRTFYLATSAVVAGYFANKYFSCRDCKKQDLHCELQCPLCPLKPATPKWGAMTTFKVNAQTNNPLECKLLDDSTAKKFETSENDENGEKYNTEKPNSDAGDGEPEVEEGTQILRVGCELGLCADCTFPTRVIVTHGCDWLVYCDSKTRTPFWVVETISSCNVQHVEHRHCEAFRMSFRTPVGFRYGHSDNCKNLDVDHITAPIVRWVDAVQADAETADKEKADTEKADVEKVDAEIAVKEKAGEEKASVGKAGEEKASVGKASGGKSSGGKASGGKTGRKKPMEKRWMEEKPIKKKLMQKKPMQKKPMQKKRMQKKPKQKKPMQRKQKQRKQKQRKQKQRKQKQRKQKQKKSLLVYRKRKTQDGSCKGLSEEELIPSHFFKAILCRNPDGSYRFECYKIPNEPICDECINLADYLVSRADLENDAGFCLFPHVPIYCMKQANTHPDFHWY
uniref:ENPP1-3/EXOG-like endonuclease/phosphodiesterase domain-containing protein n=1 Tax=Strigamia maritima TaxID=126957 RepID=T1ITM4_STRMM